MQKSLQIGCILVMVKAPPATIKVALDGDFFRAVLRRDPLVMTLAAKW
jgi:hypothetical protein